MVELFAAPDLPKVPDSGQRVGSACHQVGELPTPAELNEPIGARTPRTGFSPASTITASASKSREVFPCRPAPLRRRASLHRIEHRDYSQQAGRRRPRPSVEDYSDEPPSNRTSTSRCIRLYGSTSRRVVSPASLSRLVRLGLPGDAAHLNHASKAPRY